MPPMFDLGMNALECTSGVSSAIIGMYYDIRRAGAAPGVLPSQPPSPPAAAGGFHMVHLSYGGWWADLTTSATKGPTNLSHC